MDRITAIIVAALVLAILTIFYVIARMYRKVGPNQALIIYGWGGTHIVTGGGAIVWPMIQTARELSLELMSFDVAPKQNLYTVQGVAVTVEAVAQIKVKSDPESITTAAEQFLNKDPLEREGLIRLVMEGHLRGIVGQLTVEAIVKEPEMVSAKMRSTCAEDLSKMGLEVVSFTIKEVRDQNEYIANMGRPDVARIRRDADVATAEAERDTAIKRAVYMREAAQAKAQADMERVQAETASAAKQAEAVRDLEVKKADYQAAISRQKASADKAYDIQANIMQQQVIAEQVRIERVRKEEQIKVEEAEIQRRERELLATVLKAAEIERQKIAQLAEAERQKLAIEAQGRAEATRLEAQGQADAIRATGLAEADAIKAKGFAEAEAMTVKANAFHEYNQAFVIDKLLSSLPEVARAISEPLRNVDRITVLSTGNGSNAGLDKVTGDIGKMIVQIPALFETLAGVDLKQLLERVPQIGEKAAFEKGTTEKTAGQTTPGSADPSKNPPPA
ncbi:MAG: SPFH domain-containing protein [Candidatus Sumerlaeaceae bacterium]|nr:SPFH domain-containing protein [Candidatus Sumerlaeaceae bacterium]